MTSFEAFGIEKFDHTHLMGLIFGCSGSGKTFLTRDLLYHINKHKYWRYVVLMSPTERISATMGVAHEENVFDTLDLDFIKNQIEIRKTMSKLGHKLKPMLFIIDDCASDPRLRLHNSPIDTLFISGRHLKMGCIILLQNMNRLNSVTPPLRNNATFLAITRPRKALDRQFIVREWFSMGSEKEGETALLDLTRDEYNFAVVDLHKFSTASSLTDFIYRYKAKQRKPFVMGLKKIPKTLRQYKRASRNRKRKKYEESQSNSESETELEHDSLDSDSEGKEQMLQAKKHKRVVKNNVRGRVESLSYANGEELTFFAPYERYISPTRRYKRPRIVEL